MPIDPFLIGDSFDPEHVRAMGVAFENACQSLGLTDTNDRLTTVIAGKIVETARTGERDVVRLYESVMRWACAA